MATRRLLRYTDGITHIVSIETVGGGILHIAIGTYLLGQVRSYINDFRQFSVVCVEKIY